MDTVNTTSKKGWKVLELVIFWWITWPVITWALTCYWFITWNDKLECYLFIFIWLPWIFPVQFGTMKPNKASAGLWNHEKNVPFGRIKPELWEKWVNWLQLTLAKSVSLGKPNLRLFMTWQYCFAKFCPWVFGRQTSEAFMSLFKSFVSVGVSSNLIMFDERRFPAKIKSLQ